VRFFHPNNEVVRYLTMEEYQRLLEAAEEGPWYLRPLIELSANTGLRRGNLLSLRWEEIDLETRVIRKTITKNNRTLALPLTERVVQILEALQEGREGDAAFVFPHWEGQQAGRPILDIKNSFRAALRRAGIGNFRWHDLRHCFGSWLVRGGAKLVAVQKLMGHRSNRITMRYAHLSPQYLKGEVEILNKNVPEPCPSDATKSGKEQQQEAKKEDDRS
jgi:integrase